MATEEQKRRAREALLRSQEADDYLTVLRGGDDAEETLARRATALEAGDFAPGDLRIERGRIQTKDGQVVWPTPDTEDLVRARIGSAAAANPESVGIGVRAGRGVKMSPGSARQFTQAATGSSVIDTPEGEAVIGPGGRPQLVDKPFELGNAAQIIGMAFPFLAPSSAVAAEILHPGTTVEAAKDVADLSGDAIELGLEAAGELIMRKAGVGPLKRIPAQAGLSGVGVLARRAVSETMPGEDIGMEETLRRAGTSAVLSGVAEGVTTPLAEMAIVPGGTPSIQERMLGRTLRGKGSAVAEAEAARLGQKTGVDFLPAEQTLDANALGFTDALRNNPGVAERFMEHGGENIIAASSFTKKRLDALLGSSLPQKDVATKVHATTKAYYDKLDAARKADFKARVEPYRDVGVVADNAAEVSRSLRDAGYKVPEIKPGMTLDQLQRQLSDAGTRSWGGGAALNADRTVDQWVGQQIKDALLKDLEMAAADPSLADAAEALLGARQSYAEMSRPLDDAKLDVVQRILGLKEKKSLEKLPAAILGEGVSDEQVEILFKVLDKDDPGVAMNLRRNLVDETLVGTEAARGNTPVLARAAAEGEARGVVARNPRQVATAIMDNRKRLAAAIGDPGAMSELDDIAKVFNRLSVDKAVGSKTAMRTWWERALSPVRAVGEAGRWVLRSRLTDMLLDPARRDMLVGLAKVPQNELARTAATTLEQLAAMEAYGEVFPPEEEPVP